MNSGIWGTKSSRTPMTLRVTHQQRGLVGGPFESKTMGEGASLPRMAFVTVIIYRVSQRIRWMGNNEISCNFFKLPQIRHAQFKIILNYTECLKKDTYQGYNFHPIVYVLLDSRIQINVSFFDTPPHLVLQKFIQRDEKLCSENLHANVANTSLFQITLTV